MTSVQIRYPLPSARELFMAANLTSTQEGSVRIRVRAPSFCFNVPE